MKKSTHLQTLEGRQPIILIALGQPIGPEEYINDFTFFVGTLSRMPNLCPLNVEKLTDMDMVYKGVKERIWKYFKARMEEIASQQAGEHVEGGKSSNSMDPFEAVMGKERTGRVRLYERRVTASTLETVSPRSSGTSVYVPKELLQSIIEDVTA
ncbi:hypothetical protein Dimus_007994 [Dionaea muscipula]